MRKLPVPYAPHVKLSARSRLGKISHNEVSAILSVIFQPGRFFHSDNSGIEPLDDSK